MSQEQGAGSAGEGAPSSPAAPPPGAIPLLDTPGVEPAPGGGVVRKTSRLLKSAVMKTGELIVATEDKVAEQWAKATGNVLTHSAGYSWRKSEEGAEVVRRWTAPMKPVRARRPHWVWGVLLLGLLALAVGMGVWLTQNPAAPTSGGGDKPEPLF